MGHERLPTKYRQLNRQLNRGGIDSRDARRFVLALCLGIIVLSETGWAQNETPEVIQQRATAAGLERFKSKHLTLYTDIRDNPSIAELPHVFDLAVPQWAEFLNVPADKLADWHMTGFIMKDAARFRRAGFLPDDLPDFLHAFQRGKQFWVYEQPSDYYRRHLVLHEGTHGVMERLFRGGGPPWYMEGTAELESTHRWDGSKLQLGVVPDSKDDFAYLGRLKVIRNGQNAGNIPSMNEIMTYDNRAHLRVEPYAWCWALAVFLDTAPRTRQSFRALAPKGANTSLSFSSEFIRQHALHRVDLENGWQAFAADLDYGSSPKHQIPDSRPRQTLTDSADVTILAAHGWQGTGIVLEAGNTYRLTSTSRFRLGAEPGSWWSEPQGITIDYHRGRPIGMLLGALAPEPSKLPSTDRVEQPGSFLEPVAIGRDFTWKVKRTSRLFLKINESTGNLADNGGTVEIHVSKQ